MGLRTYVAPVACKIALLEPISIVEQAKDDIREQSEGCFDQNFTLNGWTFLSNETINNYAEFGDCFGAKITKNNLEVFEINESPYESVGGLDQTFFAKDILALKEFCNDFGLDLNQIESPAAIQQTL